MRHSRLARRWPLALLTIVVATTLMSAEQTRPATAKKAITHDVYDSWRSIQATKLSRDGAWLTYALVAQDGDGELVVRNVKTGAEYRQPRGKEPVVTADARFVIFTIAPKKADTDKAKKDKKKPEEMPKNALGIMSLADGKVTTVERVKNFKVAEDASAFVAYLMEAPEKKAEEKKAEAKPEEKKEPAAKPEEKAAPKKKEKKKDAGTELVVRDLAAGTEAKVAEVIEYTWSKDGVWLAYSTASAATSKTPGDGAFVRRVADGTTKTLLSGEGHYKGLAFDEPGRQLAFVTDRDNYKADAPAFKLYHWTSTADTAREIVASSIPTGWAVSENGALEFSRDGSKLFFGTAPAPKADPEDAPDPIKVDLWSWKDPDLQPMQKVRAEDEKKRNYRAVASLNDGRCVQLATPDMPEIRLSEDAKVAIGTSDVPYRMLVSWDSSYSDYYAVGLTDGSRRKLLEKAKFGASLSPGGTYLLTFDPADNNWYSIRVADGKKTNLTQKLGVHFENESSDTPEAPRPYGTAGWTEGDRSVLLYDEFDVWEVKPDGTSPRMITKGLGRRQKTIFRYVRLDTQAAGRRDEGISTTKPVLLSATNDVTKASGYYRLASIDAAADPAKLIVLDKLVGGVQKARNADVVVFTEQRFDEFPDLWTSDVDFAAPKKVSNANPQQANYVWGKSELIDYVNADGVPLKAILTKPDNFDPSKKYPLMVYIYEQLTDGLHRYTAPAPGTSINLTRYVSNGYVLLQPDIIYKTGYPGQAALKCVIPAVQKMLSLGYIDPKRVGIQGHSWGGYQITYLVTQTNMFAAVEAGAAVSDMVSAYGGIRWGSGMSRAFQYEHTQSRIGAAPWERPLQFIENSPIFWVEKVQTPYLTIHNDDDDAVPWYQGIEFFSAMRRLGKEAYMFVFNGEKHGLRDRENQKYFTVHMAEFFDHYLLGAPRPEWMDKGVPYLERGKRDLRAIYGTKTTDK